MSKNEKHRIRVLMKKYLDQSCTPEEREELIEKIKKTTRAEELDEVLKEVWLETEGTEALDELTWDRVLEVSSAKQRRKMHQVWRQVARWSAAAVLLVAVYFMVDRWNRDPNVVVYQTDYGQTQDIVLDDGTVVSLNANSKLIWDNQWSKDQVRHVELEGEAYFDVSHVDITDAEGQRRRMPFEVETSDLTINVLGTAFNATQRRGKTEVFLERGLVDLTLHKIESPIEKSLNTSENSNSVIRMKPGDLVSFSSADEALVQKKLETTEQRYTWRSGTLSYRDVEFRVMLQNLEDIYGKTFEVEEEELLSRRVEFGVPFSKWSTVTEMMEVMLKIEIIETEEIVKIKKRTLN